MWITTDNKRIEIDGYYYGIVEDK